MKRILLNLILIAFLVVPGITFAQFGPVDSFIGDLTGFISGTLIPVIIATAFLVFLYGAIKFFFWKSGDPEEQKKGQQLMIYAVVGFVLIVSIWGIIRLVAEGLNLNKKDGLNLPEPPALNKTKP